MKKASVIIITKNDEENIAGLLEMLSYQDFKNFEVIVADLCSTDKTLAKARPYPVKAFRLETKEGFFRALNLASRISIGEIIFCLGGNNLPEGSDYLSSGIKVMSGKKMALGFGPKSREHEAPIVKLFNPKNWTDPSQGTRIIEGKEIKEICLDSFVFKKSLWQKNNFSEDEEVAVWHWSSRMVNQGYKICFNSAMSLVTHGKTGLINYLQEKRRINQQFKGFREREKNELSH